MLNGRLIVAFVYKDGSDLDYQALYFLPDNMTPQMFADLHAHYEASEDDFGDMYTFDEWCLQRCGIVVESIEPDQQYDAWTGQAWWG